MTLSSGSATPESIATRRLRLKRLLVWPSPPMRNLGLLLTDLGARVALAYGPAERLLRAGIRRPRLRRRLKLGAVALGYTRVLQSRALRIAELDGYRFWVNVAEPLGIEPYFFGRPGTVWLAPRLVRPGDVCVDVGANAGHYTFMCAHAVGDSGRVISLEPNPNSRHFFGSPSASMAIREGLRKAARPCSDERELRGLSRFGRS